ncbi:gelsolin repeat protein [Purpureocillium lavendulum]|uniref:Gelsolin repeat protein n=1 Tax=Purpureocillium lavendulum TaxID=1247861 RepID=A0AB34G514_9HYPO|nr:gelsolin repeat protein [Purpureocillium lavendulum]
MSDLKPAKELDPNVWYHISEARVDDYKKKKFGGMLQSDDKGTFFVFASDKNQYYQFLAFPRSKQPVDGKAGRFAIRASKTAINKQLGVCRVQAETDSSKTRPCMLSPDGSDVQKWDVANWGNDTYRLVNVANGTDYNLDVHPGAAVFLSSNIDTKVYQAAQHWLMTSAKPVNDGAYSTVFTDVPVSTITSAGTTKTISSHTGTATSDPGTGASSSGGLSSGAAAGIGVGVALGVIAASLIAFFLWRRRRRAAARGNGAAAELGDSQHGAAAASTAPGSYRDNTYSPEKTTPVPPYSNANSPPPQPQELPHNPAPVEAPADERFELDSTPHGDRR